MDPERSLPCSQEPASVSCPDPAEYSPRHHFLSLAFLSKIIICRHISSTRVTRPVHLILIDLTTPLKILNYYYYYYNLRNSLLSSVTIESGPTPGDIMSKIPPSSSVSSNCPQFFHGLSTEFPDSINPSQDRKSVV
jgi:hypothetical protein